MRSRIFTAAVGGLIVVLCPPAFGQGIPAGDPVRVLVGRLDLDRYKATIISLTEFGDRRQGTDRNRAAIDWIERQLKSFGCNTARIKYEYSAPEPQFRLKSGAPIPVASAYVAQRAALQGIEDPPGSGRYPEPKWLGMVQHDMVLFDHGMPRADGTPSPEQRPEADVNVEFQSTAKFADQAMRLAFFFRDANEKYAADYPAAVGHHMTNTDSTPFMDLVPAISVRESERGMQIGAGWSPHWHQPTDRYSAYSDKDFRLRLNAAQTTLAAIAQLTGAALKR